MFQNKKQKDLKAKRKLDLFQLTFGARQKTKKKVFRQEKKHTDKALIAYSTDLNQILSVATDVGSVHDFKMFKQSRIWKFQIIQNANTELDLGFVGVQKYLKKAVIPAGLITLTKIYTNWLVNKEFTYLDIKS